MRRWLAVLALLTLLGKTIVEWHSPAQVRPSSH